MKVSIEEISTDLEEQIIIKCYKVNDRVLSLVNQLKNDDKVTLGYDDDNIHRINIKDIYYFESVDNKVFIYCKKKVYESKQKLYELEEILIGKNFFRVSKTTIINFERVAFVKPSISGRFEAKLDNGEKVSVSRHYVPVLKQKLGI